MATIVKRGPRNDPRYYARYDYGLTPDGKRRQCFKLLRGIVSKDQATQEIARVERELAAGRDPFPGPIAAPEELATLLERFGNAMKNRNADDDRSKVTRYLIERFGGMMIDQVTLPVVMRWLDDLAKTNLSGQTQRHLVNLLSRFFSWAIARGHATSNPVKMVPQGDRPKGRGKADGPWLEDDSKVRGLMDALGPVVGLMFYIGNRSGLRLGEICGLTMGDMNFLAEGRISVSHSYGGPLKEDRRCVGKTKMVPAPLDADEVLGRHLLRRRKLDGATDADLVFPFVPDKPQNRRRTSTWTGYRKEYIEACWEEATKGLGLTWYQATRHTFVSRCRAAGASLDEVADAVGHSSPEVTRRFYDHWERKTFSQTLRQGLTS